MSCLDLASRTNLASLSYDASPVWCFQLDSSHPEVAAAIGGTCEDHYTTMQLAPGLVKLCVLVGGKCKSGGAARR